MAAVFHWLKVRLFCYATEDEEKLHLMMKNISGTDDFHAEMSDGHHGNAMTILTADLKGNAECKELFIRLGRNVIDNILNSLEDRIDEECTLRLRLDKQAAVSEIYETADHGDVVSITCKIASHPARKDIAETNMRTFLENVLSSL
jgi:hypothetical protein